MKAIISSTYDSKYLFFLPITTWLWNRLGVDVICFMPHVTDEAKIRNKLVWDTIDRKSMMCGPVWFNSPKHKEATYAQCSRLYAAALDLPDDEILITSDVDMGLFKLPVITGGSMTINGIDLVPPNQIPICYIGGSVAELRKRFKINGRTYQQCLDDLLSLIEADHFRGNYWGKDQEEAYNNILGDKNQHAILLSRARPGTQFAESRVDRDDINWRSYVNDSLIDAHLWRPGYEENNFNNILELLQMKYPSDDFTWLVNYRNEYIKLLQ